MFSDVCANNIIAVDCAIVLFASIFSINPVARPARFRDSSILARQLAILQARVELSELQPWGERPTVYYSHRHHLLYNLQSIVVPEKYVPVFYPHSLAEFSKFAAVRHLIVWKPFSQIGRDDLESGFMDCGRSTRRCPRSI